MYIQDSNDLVPYLADTLKKHLAAGESVLWLIPGGSGIDAAIQVAQHLESQDLTQLYVTLTDERYGDLGHADENWQQLLDKGFSLPGAQLYRVLQQGLDRQQTADAFAETINTFMQKTDYAIGYFGIGADGHTAGIKPKTVAVTAEALAVGYEGPDFQRITMTFAAIKGLDEAVVYAVGDAKWQVIQNLLHDDLALDEQPAQILNRVPKVTIFTDYVEEK